MLTKYTERIMLNEETPMAKEIASEHVYEMACGLDSLYESIKTGRKIREEDIINLANVSRILKLESEGGGESDA